MPTAAAEFVDVSKTYRPPLRSRPDGPGLVRGQLPDRTGRGLRAAGAESGRQNDPSQNPPRIVSAERRAGVPAGTPAFGTGHSGPRRLHAREPGLSSLPYCRHTPQVLRRPGMGSGRDPENPDTRAAGTGGTGRPRPRTDLPLQQGNGAAARPGAGPPRRTGFARPGRAAGRTRPGRPGAAPGGHRPAAKGGQDRARRFARSGGGGGGLRSGRRAGPGTARLSRFARFSAARSRTPAASSRWPRPWDRSIDPEESTP